MERFAGRVALVTGAGSGIGRATTVRLAAEGAVVVAVDVTEDGLAGTRDECDPTAVVDTVIGDVTDRTLAAGVTNDLLERHGRLDVLVNVAGILRTANTHEHSLEAWDQVLAVNPAVCPGSITTPITEQFEFPDGADVKLVERIMAIDMPRGPETVAATIAFLASDEAAHVNGEHVRVDGGTLP